MNNITVVIPNYNGAKYLPACLDSLKADKAARVIVIDNGSTDESVSVLISRHSDVEVIALSANKGFSYAVNIGIKRAKTPYVILLNPDTVVRPGFIEGLERAISCDRRIFSVAAKMLDMNEPARLDAAGDLYSALGWAYNRGKGKPEARYNERARVFSACAGAGIYRRALVERLGYFDEAFFAYLEDVDIGYGARLAGYRNYFSPDAKVLHAGSAVTGSRYNERKTFLSARNSVYLVSKNMPPLQIIFNAPFLLAGFALKLLFFVHKGMGKEYLRGLAAGLRLSSQPSSRAKRRRPTPATRKHYFQIQGELLANMFRRW